MGLLLWSTSNNTALDTLSEEVAWVEGVQEEEEGEACLLPGTFDCRLS